MDPIANAPDALLAEALAIAGVGCWFWKPDTGGTHGRLEISANFRQLLNQGETWAPTDRASWVALSHADDRPLLEALFASLDQAELRSATELTLRLRDGAGLWHWFEVRLPATTGKPPGATRIVTFNKITALKQAEAALRDSQLRFRALYNTSPLACIVWDRQGHISEWNQRAEALFGWRAEEVVGKQVHRLLLPGELHPQFSEAVSDVIQQRGDGIFVGRAIAKNGLYCECNWYNVALRAPNGKLSGVLSLVLDVTEERLAHLALERSEKIYRTLVETSPDAILVLEMKGTLQMANQQAHRLFGLDEMDVLANIGMRELMAPECRDKAEFIDRPEEFIGFIATRQVRLQTLAGTPFDASIAFSTMMNSRGHSSGIVLFARDITDKLRADRELEAHRDNLERLVGERTVELENIRNSLAKIIEGSPVPTFVIDADHVITHWNKACEQISGVPAEQMLGTRDQWKGFYPSRRPVMADLVITGEIAQVRELYASKYRESTLIPGAYEAEDYFAAFDRWLFFTAAPLRDAQGKIIGAIETLQDVTERKLAEIAMREAKRTAESAAEAKASFLANMSHEIRTPMNAVIGLAHLLLKGELTKNQRDYVSRIHGAGQMLLGLINDILDFSKIEAGQMHLESAEFALDDVFDNITTVLIHRAQEKGLELLYVIEPEVPPNLLGDPLRLSQILINLIGNAIKFTATGSITVFVRHRESQGKITLEVDVQDTGIGMTEEQAAGLFRAFSQADTSITRKYGGTGLGLTICKRLAQLMNGEIWVNSQPGIGSTFSFTVEVGRGSSSVHNSQRGLQRAMVVDDSPLARAILVRLLEKRGYTAVPANSGEEALQCLAENRAPFDFITIDLNMPGMDGLELAETIREQCAPAPRLVMVTAADTTTLDGDRRLDCFDAVLNKPVTASQIGRLIDETRNLASGSDIAPAPLAGVRVLLVEDMLTNQLIAREILTAFGITVDTADHGGLAVKKLLEDGQQYDIVLMDIQMPEMDGLEATRRIRASGRWPALPIIAMTAHAIESERNRCLAVGMSDFLTKPIDPELLEKTLLRWRAGHPTETPAPKTEKVAMTAPDGLPDLPGIDKADGLRRMMNKPTLYEKVLRDFHSRFKTEADLIRDAISAGDFSTAERRAHSTKGLAGTIGAPDLHIAAKELEVALRQGEAPPESLFSQFEQEMARVINGIAIGFGLEADH